MEKSYFTSESVTEGHPDKLADQISDGILDACLESDPNSRVACETLVTTGLCLIAGEITTKSYVDFQKTARGTIQKVGYNNASYGFDYKTCAVVSTIDEQSPDIAQGVNREGAGDQGMMFGYACRETPELMPLPIMLAHKLCEMLAERRKSGEIPYLRPDGKAQVTVEYEGDRPVSIPAVVISTQHDPDVKQNTIREEMIRYVAKTVLPEDMLSSDTAYHINPTGRFVVGGPHGDAGLTGRKIIVDTYGGMAPHGGGAFSGKDPTKVDRSACYMARTVAKTIVAAELADRCQVQLAYAIGIADPVSVRIETFGTGKFPEDVLVRATREVFLLTPKGIAEYLDLRRPIYMPTAAYGHFGRSEELLPWETTRSAKELVGACAP